MSRSLILLFAAFITGSLVHAQPTNGNAGKVIWSDVYLLELARPGLEGPETKAYLAGVTQNLIADELSLQRSAVTRGKLSPLSIEYSLQPTHDALPADERAALLARYAKPEVLPLKIVRVPALPADAKDCANRKDDRYTLSTRIRAAGTKVTLHVALCQGPEILHAQSTTVDEQELVAGVTRLVNPIRAKLTGDNFASLKIETNPEHASVYLDDQFLGKTPVNYSYLIPGKYRLVVKHEGYESQAVNIETRSGSVFAQAFTLSPGKTGGRLELVTDPPDARIYLDADYKGKTPKTLENITLGTYRLHLLVPEKGEVYKTITLTETSPSLKVSETLTDFVDQRQSGLLGLSYKTWYYMSLTTSAVFFGSGIAFYVWRDEAQEQIFGRLSGKSVSQYTAEDNAFLAEQNAAYATRGSYATAFTVSAGFFAVLSIYFYVQHLLSADEGIVMKQKPKTEEYEIRVGAMPGNQGISAHFHF
jgi:hypothetical protein